MSELRFIAYGTPRPQGSVKAFVRGNRARITSDNMAWTTFNRALRIFRYRWNGFLVDPTSTDDRVHPTQKPLALMKWCLGFAPDAKTVIDPFMGSGTTLEACKARGIAATGIEIEERYCEIAAKRLSQEVFDFGEVTA